MEYLKLFGTQIEYETYVDGGGLILPNVSLVEENMSLGYAPYVPHDYTQDYFTMVVTTGGGSITWSGSTDTNMLSYSKDNGTTWSTASSRISLPVNGGDKVLWKGTTIPITSYPYGIGVFHGSTNVRYSIEGNVMSLLYGDDFKGQISLAGKNYALFDLFGGSSSDNTNVTNAENLSLPATTLALSCYETMFRECVNLTTTPELPATVLAEECYSAMFQNCTSLTTAPSVLPATTLVKGCYSSMFIGCSNLTTIPELPAITLVDSCYSNMFRRCTSLNSIKCLATSISANRCTSYWVENVAASGTFTKAPGTTWSTGINGIPSGWTVVDA